MTDQFTDRFSIKPGVVPALGLAWSSSIDMRIKLSKTKRMYTVDGESAPSEPTLDFENSNAVVKKKRKLNEGTVIREMKILFSPHLENGSCNFIVDWAGIHGVE